MDPATTAAEGSTLPPTPYQPSPLLSLGRICCDLQAVPPRSDIIGWPELLKDDQAKCGLAMAYANRTLRRLSLGTCGGGQRNALVALMCV